MTVRLLACAKINLTLEVLRQRDDGYHEVLTVLQTIGLADELTFEPRPVGELALAGDTAGAPGEQNLVMRAARALQQALGERRGARIALRKEIPVAAGLGGGSSDAAASLLGLTRLWGREVTMAHLAGIAAGLGSDVPFFLTGGTALGEGRGERVSPLPPLPERWLVLLTPPAEIAGKTGRLYGALSTAAFTDGAATRRLVAALRAGEPVTPAHLVNAFERVAGQVYPEYERWRRALLEAGAPAVHLAGSGPSLFSLVSDRAEGEAMARRLVGRGAAVSVVKTVARPYNRDW